MMRVLLTGASGFIGRHVAEVLLERGHVVHGVARRGGGADGVTWHAADILDCASASAVVAAARPEAVVHLAWDVTPGEYLNSATNIEWAEATGRLARAFAAHGEGGRFVGIGSSAEYGYTSGAAREDATPRGKLTPYGGAKRAAAELLEVASHALGLSTAWCRLFQVHGPGERPQRLIPSAVRSLSSGVRFVCGPSLAQRDLLHVRDAAAAIVTTMESEAAGVVNVASGESMTIREVLFSVARAAGASEELLRFDGPTTSPIEDADMLADVGRLRDEIGWRPAFGLDEGIADTVRWWRSAGGAAA
jgi:nucleoside-diphosphate-sugar epimerase